MSDELSGLDDVVHPVAYVEEKVRKVVKDELTKVWIALAIVAALSLSKGGRR